LPAPSQLPAEHTAPVISNASAGQSADAPSQVSSTSHGPVAGRQTVPAAEIPVGTQAGVLPLQSIVPEAQVPPASQGAPSTQTPPSVPPSGVMLGVVHPISGWQYSPSAHAPATGTTRHAPCRQAPIAHAAATTQWSSFEHSASGHVSVFSRVHVGATQAPPQHSVAVGLPPGSGHVTPAQLRVIVTVIPIVLASANVTARSARRPPLGSRSRTRTIVSPGSRFEYSATRRPSR